MRPGFLIGVPRLQCQKPTIPVLPVPSVSSMLPGGHGPIATVSRFINESVYVGAASRWRIETAIRELDFTPSISARSLNTRRSHVIGFVVSSIAHPFSAEVSRGIQDVVTAAGYVLSVSSTDGRSDIQVAALRTLHAHRVDAVIVTPPNRPKAISI